MNLKKLISTEIIERDGKKYEVKTWQEKTERCLCEEKAKLEARLAELNALA